MGGKRLIPEQDLPKRQASSGSRPAPLQAMDLMGSERAPLRRGKQGGTAIVMSPLKPQALGAFLSAWRYLNERGKKHGHHPHQRRRDQRIGISRGRCKRVQRREPGGLPRTVPESCARRHMPCLWRHQRPEYPRRALRALAFVVKGHCENVKRLLLLRRSSRPHPRPRIMFL